MTLHNELFVRLGAIISSAVCIWLMFKAGTALNNARTGWFAALLYATSIYSGMSIAAYILPDSPQMMFWLASLYTLIKIIRLNPNDPRFGNQWLLFGLLAGLSIMCKVHGVFLWFGAVMYFLIYNRSQLKSKYFFMAIGITLIVISPIIAWNFQHDFITYRFHSARVFAAGPSIDFARFIKQFAEIVSSTGPIHFVLICIGVYYAVKGKLLVGKSEMRMVLFCTLPLIFIVWIIALFNKVMPHWSGPALSSLLLFPAVHLATNLRDAKSRMPTVLKFAAAYLLLIVILDFFVINYFPGTLSIEKQGMKIGADDGSLDMYGWKQAGLKFDSVYRSDRAANLMPANPPIVISDWITAAHIDYYIGKPVGLESWGLGDVYSLHQYFWMNNHKRPLKQGESAYLIIPTNLFSYKNFNKVVGDFKDYHFAAIFPEYRSGMICKQYYIIRLYGYKGAAAVSRAAIK